MQVPVDEKVCESVGKILNDPSRPMKERFRALFTLKNLGGLSAIDWISKCFNDPSALLKHECAYCLGQMQDPAANSILKKILEDKTQEPMVRHEAGEALGAIGSLSNLEILKEYCNDPVIEVAETCELAVKRLEWLHDLQSKESGLSENPYKSVDPAPPALSSDIEFLKKTLLDESLSIFNRYRAMFSLRNIGTKEAVLALSSGLKCGSALFRHEIAYVLGQMQSDACVLHLTENLKDLMENEMVRHECAEALGSIATEECVKVLNDHIDDDKQVVRESCEVALDMYDYENSAEFQYADTILKVQKQNDETPVEKKSLYIEKYNKYI